MNKQNGTKELLPIKSKFTFLQDRLGGCSAYEINEHGLRSCCADFYGNSPLDIKRQMKENGYSNIRVVTKKGKKLVYADRNYLTELDIIKAEIDKKEKT